jgi:hypothetical protein
MVRSTPKVVTNIDVFITLYCYNEENLIMSVETNRLEGGEKC